MCKGIQVGNRFSVTYPHTFLTGVLKAGVVALTFRTQGIGAFEISAVPVNGESYVVGQGDVFCAAAVFFPVVEIFVVAWAICIRGGFQRTAEFLASPSAVGEFTVLPHGKPGVTDRISLGQKLWIFGIAFVQRDDTLPAIEGIDLIIYILDIISLVGEESTLRDG